MTSMRVGALGLGTGTTKISFVSRQIPPNTHCSETTRPRHGSSVLWTDFRRPLLSFHLRRSPENLVEASTSIFPSCSCCNQRRLLEPCPVVPRNTWLMSTPSPRREWTRWWSRISEPITNTHPHLVSTFCAHAPPLACFPETELHLVSFGAFPLTRQQYTVLRELGACFFSERKFTKLHWSHQDKIYLKL